MSTDSEPPSCRSTTRSTMSSPEPVIVSELAALDAAVLNCTKDFIATLTSRDAVTSNT